MRPLALALAIALALGPGCLRVGSGDDLHLVCEEKTASPRKAYDVGFLVAQTRVDGELDDKTLVAMLEAVRHHVITPGGRPHADFTASLAPAHLRDRPDAWLFDAVAGSGPEAPPDLYVVTVWQMGDAWVAAAPNAGAGVIRPPHSIAQPAWDAANASSAVRDALPNGSYPLASLWEPSLPSCVRLTYGSVGGVSLEVVVNVVEDRIVFLDRPGSG